MKTVSCYCLEGLSDEKKKIIIIDPVMHKIDLIEHFVSCREVSGWKRTGISVGCVITMYWAHDKGQTKRLIDSS